jgi:hypothetical protein
VGGRSAGGQVRCSGTVPGSPYPPPQDGESPGNKPGQNEWIEHNARDRIPMHHEEDSSAAARRVSRKRAIRLPDCDPGFVLGRQKTAYDHLNH